MAGGITIGIWYMVMSTGSSEPPWIAASALGQRKDHGSDIAAPVVIPAFNSERRESLTSPTPPAGTEEG
jgi:hypothetical protein